MSGFFLTRRCIDYFQTTPICNRLAFTTLKLELKSKRKLDWTISVWIRTAAAQIRSEIFMSKQVFQLINILLKNIVTKITF